MNLERDHERLLTAPTPRAEAEAKRILGAALEQAAVLQAEMSKQVELQTRRRISVTEAEIDERLAVADREAAERVRQAVETAAELLENARREAEKLREELVAAARDQLSEADQLSTQRLLDAEIRAREIIDRARSEATTLPPVDLAKPEDRVWSGHREPLERRSQQGRSPAGGHRDPESAAASTDHRRRLPRLATTIRVAILVVAAVMVSDLVRSCVAEPYTVASTSMEPELADGDRLIVNKVAYRLGDVQRGDVVVYDTSHVPGATRRLGRTLVKRVIGLPGNVVQAVDGRVLIDGEQLDEPWLDDVQTPPFGPVELPEGSLFLLGDDRVLSVDSRAFGAVPIDAIVGRVDAVIWPPGNLGRV